MYANHHLLVTKRLPVARTCVSSRAVCCISKIGVLFSKRPMHMSPRPRAVHLHLKDPLSGVTVFFFFFFFSFLLLVAGVSFTKHEVRNYSTFIWLVYSTGRHRCTCFAEVHSRTKSCQRRQPGKPGTETTTGQPKEGSPRGTKTTTGPSKDGSPPSTETTTGRCSTCLMLILTSLIRA